MTRRIVIDPVTRVEGHGKVTIRMDEAHRVVQTRLHIVEFRGFERFVQGRPFWEAIVLVQRLCGICPVSHHLCAAKAMDVVSGIGPHDLTPTAEKMRRLMHYGQVFQSHVLHFFHLASPDLLFGVDADPARRNVVGVIDAFPDLARQAVLMRKFGQEVIAATAGKKIHGTGAIPGGINKHLTPAERDALLAGAGGADADTMVQWAEEALALFAGIHERHAGFVDGFAAFPSNYLSLVRADGAMDLYDGGIRAVDRDGRTIVDHVDVQGYADLIAEETRPWTYMKFPYLRRLGRDEGWYRVGPLARLNTCSFIPTPRAQAALERYRAYTGGRPHEGSLHMHWARLIETLHAAEVIRDLLRDPDLLAGELRVQGTRRGEGVGVIEAPRGTLIHHYRVGDDDLVSMCNLIVSTTHNNEGMNRAVGWVADHVISGHDDVTEAMLNQVEVAIRAYDPCLSCATHALGQMPLVLRIETADGALVREIVRHGE